VPDSKSKKLLVLRVAGRNSAAIIAIATSLTIPQECSPARRAKPLFPST
jgi:hypothetical protein